MVVASGFPGDAIHFYRSLGTDLATNPGWEFIDRAPNPLPNEEDAHQALQFLRQDGINGQLYLAGSRGHAIVAGFYTDHDRIDLFKVSGASENFDPGDVTTTVKYNGRRRTPYLSSGGLFDQANLAAAGGFYVTPSGELLYYATQHQNSGPGGSVPAGEWRNLDVVRPGSPTLLPTVSLNGPFEVDEGSSITLSGNASPAATKPWVQVLEGEDYESLNWIIDYEDRFKDDYDNLFNFERLFFLGSEMLNHKDTARSWKWFAPVGCSIIGIDRDSEGNVDETVVMPGTGGVERTPKLFDALNDGGSVNIDRELDAIEFGNDCQNYYATPFSLAWDMDSNGSFETVSTSPSFSASAIDGPSTQNISVQTAHPAGGPAGTGSAVVSVRNVAPTIVSVAASDSSGSQINTTVPFSLTGLPIGLGAAFTDPGRLDHQTATIDWGDGAIEGQSTFASFNDAFGDGQGLMADTHIYTNSGTYTIQTTVTDDDGGEDSESMTIRVLTPEEAVGEMIAMLDAALATCPNTSACATLAHARGALAGYNPNSNSGALKMIRAGDRPSARAFLQTAGTWLDRAEADGAGNLDVLQALSLQVSAALGN
jgi:PKD repeat protein